MLSAEKVQNIIKNDNRYKKSKDFPILRKLIRNNIIFKLISPTTTKSTVEI